MAYCSLAKWRISKLLMLEAHSLSSCLLSFSPLFGVVVIQMGTELRMSSPVNKCSKKFKEIGWLVSMRELMNHSNLNGTFQYDKEIFDRIFYNEGCSLSPQLWSYLILLARKQLFWISRVWWLWLRQSLNGAATVDLLRIVFCAIVPFLY